MKTATNTLILLSIAILIASCSKDIQKKSHPLYQKAVGLYEKAPNTSLILIDSLTRLTLDEQTLASSYYLKGYIMKKKGKLYQAQASYKKSLKYWNKLGNDQWISLTTENLANVYMDGGMWQEAYNLYGLAQGDNPYLDYNKGRSLIQLGRFQEAQQHLFKAEFSFRESGTEEDMIDLYNEIGIFYKNTQLYDKAEEYLYSGLSKSDENDDYERGKLLRNLSNTFYKQGKLRESLDNYREVLQITNAEKLTLAYYRIGDLYREMDQKDSAMVSYKAAIKHYEGTHYHDEYASSIQHVVDYYHQREQYDSMTHYSLALNAEATDVLKFRAEMALELEQTKVLLGDAEQRNAILILQNQEKIKWILIACAGFIMLVMWGGYLARHKLAEFRYNLLLRTKAEKEKIIDEQRKTIEQLTGLQ